MSKNKKLPDQVVEDPEIELPDQVVVIGTKASPHMRTGVEYTLSASVAKILIRKGHVKIKA